MTIAIDFDGTLVTHEYPEIGTPVDGALEVCLKLKKMGYTLILLTMRGICPITGRNTLEEAKQYCISAGFPFTYYNENPEQEEWTQSRKVYGMLYIDDSALGCPVIYNPKIHDRKFVDWKKVDEYLKNFHYI
jgi:hydroxymethylpyrimidine pyrophosphatase-like HAD family hydrolase